MDPDITDEATFGPLIDELQKALGLEADQRSPACRIAASWLYENGFRQVLEDDDPAVAPPNPPRWSLADWAALLAIVAATGFVIGPFLIYIIHNVVEAWDGIFNDRPWWN